MRKTFALLTLLLLSSALTAQSYKATALKPLPKGSASQTQVYGINNFGLVAGGCAVQSVLHPCIWSPNGTPLDLGLPNGLGSGVSSGINNQGEVVGTISTLSSEYAFTWTRSAGLQAISGMSNAVALNDSGAVAGFSLIGVDLHGYLYTPGSGLTDIGTLPGSFHGTKPQGMNALNHIVGYAEFPDGSVQSFLWTPETGMQQIPCLQQSCEAYAINDSDQVVGFIGSSPFYGGDAFVWSQSTGMQDLGTGQVIAINDAGGATGTNGVVATLWINGGPAQSLPQLVGGSTPPPLFAGMGINATGQIACLATNTAYLLTPKTKTKLTSSQNPSKVGQPVTFTATLSAIIGLPPDGELVTFSNGTVALGTAPLLHGVASLTTSSLIKGTHSITATYAGDVNYIGSKSAALKQVVQ